MGLKSDFVNLNIRRKDFIEYMWGILAPCIKSRAEQVPAPPLILLGYLWYVSRRVIESIPYELDEEIIWRWYDAGIYWLKESDLQAQ